MLTGCSEQYFVAKDLERLAEEAHEVTLFSLNPRSVAGTSTNTESIFHGYEILERTPTLSSEEGHELLSALADGVKNSDGMTAMCFNPRHALRIKVQKKTIDLTICFECRKVYAHGFNDDRTFYPSPAPRYFFNDVLARYDLSKPLNEAEQDPAVKIDQ